MDTITSHCAHSHRRDGWDRKAAARAEDAQARLFRYHRGAERHSNGVTLVYGNDGYDSDPRVVREVALLREKLAGRGTEVLGFGTSTDGYTWAMLVKSGRVGDLDSLVWGVWFECCKQRKRAGRSTPQAVAAEV